MMIQTSKRILSIDALRGLIMLLMALDHANYFVAQKHPSGEHWGGTFPAYQDTLSFITRLVTHLSAPGFFFLMGAGMFFFARSRRDQGWEDWKIIRHFLARGLLLTGLQLWIVNPAWKLGPGEFPAIYIGVLIALGGTMILASFGFFINPGWWLVLSGAFFVGMEWIHPQPEQWGMANPVGLIALYSGGSFSFWSNYPVLPWLELVIFGMFFGHWVSKNRPQAMRGASRLGLVFLAAFVILRRFDGFGNIRPMEDDGWIAFLNVVKYPPSMTFTLMTMGINLLLLSLLAHVENKTTRISDLLAVCGREPLFFYIIHLYLYLALGQVFFPQGTSIAKMYPAWILGVMMLYPLCRAFGNFKQNRRLAALLRYF